LACIEQSLALILERRFQPNALVEFSGQIPGKVSKNTLSFNDPHTHTISAIPDSLRTLVK
jgi:hypothetical protein